MNLHTIFALLLCGLILSSAVGQKPKKTNPTKNPSVKTTKAAKPLSETKAEGSSGATGGSSGDVTASANPGTADSSDGTAATSGGGVTASANPGTADSSDGTSASSAGGGVTASANPGTADSSNGTAATSGGGVTEKANTGTADSSDGTAASSGGGVTASANPGTADSSGGTTDAGGETTPGHETETTKHSKNTGKTKKPPVVKTLDKVIAISKQIPECNFFFQKMGNGLPTRQNTWIQTFKDAKKEGATLGEDAIDYRIPTPKVRREQPNMTLYYEESTDELPDSIEALRVPEFQAADNELDIEKFLAAAREVYKKKPRAHGYLNGSLYPKEKVVPFFRREIRLMKHRFCMFSMMILLRNSGTGKPLKYMPGFVGYNNKISRSLSRYSVNATNATAILHEHIETEFNLAKSNVNESSSMSLHGNLVGPDNETVYFRIWTKNAPGSFKNCPQNAVVPQHRGKRQAQTTAEAVATTPQSATKDRCFTENLKGGTTTKTPKKPKGSTTPNTGKTTAENTGKTSAVTEETKGTETTTTHS